MEVPHTVTELVATVVRMAPNASRVWGHRAPENAEHGRVGWLVVGGLRRRSLEQGWFGHCAPADLPTFSLTAEGVLGGCFCLSSTGSERNVAPHNTKGLDLEDNHILTVFPLQSHFVICLPQCCKNPNHLPKILGCKLVKIDSRSGLKFLQAGTE